MHINSSVRLRKIAFERANEQRHADRLYDIKDANAKLCDSDTAEDSDEEIDSDDERLRQRLHSVKRQHVRKLGL